MNSLRRFLHRLRAATFPRDASYAERLRREQEIFAGQLDVNALPAIFHYWSDRYVRRMLEEYGVSNPDHFFAKFLGESARVVGHTKPRFASLGAGNCDTEVRVAKLLKEGGLADFRIECVDINAEMLERGRALAAAEGVGEHIVTTQQDFNRWVPHHEYAGVMANQSLHHMQELEIVFDLVRDLIDDGGYFVVSDMIGRNGHQRWPEALEAVQRFWAELPDAYRYNRQLQREERQYLNWDCSGEGFEGIRAQDILPLLIERFEFYVYVAFGNVIDVFVDRAFGHNFDADAAFDRDLIDRIHAFDEASLASGALTPTHLMAVMCVGEPPARHRSRGLRPEAGVRRPT